MARISMVFEAFSIEESNKARSSEGRLSVIVFGITGAGTIQFTISHSLNTFSTDLSNDTKYPDMHSLVF